MNIGDVGWSIRWVEVSVSKSFDGVPENGRFRERGKRGAKVFESLFFEKISLADRSASSS